MAAFFGKYRGTVTNSVDPQQIGRLQVNVPDVGGNAWALPCFSPGTFAIPPSGANVWVEFEAGSPDHPVWCGVFYGSAAEVPASAAKLAGGAGFAVAAERVALQASTELSLENALGAGLRIEPSQVALKSDAMLTLKAPSINANEGALVVT